MRSALRTAAALAATATLVASQTCGGGTSCPQSAPCCSEYGACGVGAYCLQGCDPKHSFDLQSCMATPVCKSGDFKMDSLSDVQQNTVFLGDASQTNWISSGIPVVYNNNAILLTMAESTVGTLLTSTHYLWYGKVTATMTASQGQGVVTAFILMSAMKDEIDFEFVGDGTGAVQSNFYWQGVTDYNNMEKLTVDNTRNVHTYTVDWQPDQLTWSVDGQVMRTLKKSDTFNTTDNTYHYPQSPSRIQLSLWPAGLPSNGNGTIEWAGGLVNWNSQYMQNGYYYAMVQDVQVECYNPPSGFSNNFGSSAYYYTSIAGTENTVAIGNNQTTLASFYATGDNPSYNPNAASGTSSAQSSSSPSNEPQTVPGISGGGVRSNGAPISGGDSSSSSGSSSGSSGGGSSSGGSSGAPAGSVGFSQNGGANTNEGAPRLVAGSAVALMGFIIAALVM